MSHAAMDMTEYPTGTAAAAGLATCHICHKLAPASEHECPRCGAALHVRTTDSIQRTIACISTSSLGESTTRFGIAPIAPRSSIAAAVGPSSPMSIPRWLTASFTLRFA